MLPLALHPKNMRTLPTLTLAIMGRKNTSGDSSRRPFATPPATFNLAALFMETSLCSPCGLTFFVLPVPPTTGLPLHRGRR